MTSRISEERDGSQRWMLGCLAGMVSLLSKALAEFFRQEDCRISLLLEIKEIGVLLVGDKNLLRGHESELEEVIAESNNLNASNVRGYVWSNTLHFRFRRSRWFIEVPGNICSLGPLFTWLADASEVLDGMLSDSESAYIGVKMKKRGEIHVGPSTYNSDRRRIVGYATESVMEYIRDRFLDDMHSLDAGQYMAIPDFLESVLKISTMLEEGAPPRGTLCLYLGGATELPPIIRFEEKCKALLAKTKHVRKLLTTTVVDGWALVSDGDYVYGIATELSENIRLVARFRGRVGEILYKNEVICTFGSGRYYGTSFLPNEQMLHSALMRQGLGKRLGSGILPILMQVIEHAMRERHGCTIAIDSTDSPLRISGQWLTEPVLVSSQNYLTMASQMSRVDGAIYLDLNGNLLAFGCLLDGQGVDGEDLSRGARYNSAVRFTACHLSSAVIVVSEDGWISLFVNGKDLLRGVTEQDEYDSLELPSTLDSWIGAKRR